MIFDQEECATLRTSLDNAQDLLLDMVNQYCANTVRKSGMPETYSHSFMSTGEEVFAYLVDHRLAKWCENGVDICELKWSKMRT